MKNILTSAIRSLALAASILAVPAIGFAQNAYSTDPVVRALATAGVVPVKAAGPYVQVGSYHIHVIAHLGRPSAVLPDGTCLYRQFSTDTGSAQGTLVVRFEHGRVSQLSLASPVAVAAMTATPATHQFVASK